MPTQPFRGVLVPALTPFGPDLSPDADAFIAHCRWLLEQGADGLAVFGTTSEANSMSVDERIELLERLIDAGIPAARLMPGTGASALTDSVRLTGHAAGLGCGGVLMLPPFYYKGVGDDGLFAGFSEVIERVGDARLRVYLYHIPPQTQVPITLALIGRLLKAYPQTLAGLKDSSGDWNNTKAVLDEFPGFGTFAGSEIFLLDTLRGGGMGCITATGNINPGGIRRVYENWQTDQADALQARITEIRVTVQAYPMIPALKTLAGGLYGSDSWAVVRPPLQRLDSARAEALRADLLAIGFDMGANRDSVAA